jgi:peptide/nickel transport system permease protein
MKAESSGKRVSQGREQSENVLIGRRRNTWLSRHPVLRRLIKNRLAQVGLAICLTTLFAAAFAPVLAPFDPSAVRAGEPLSAPSLSHLFGTDELGRDLFSRMLYAARIALLVGLVASALAAFFGVPIGLVTGYYGGWFDSIVMRVTDAWLAFPIMVLALGLTAALGPSVTNVTVAIAFVNIPNFIRLTRGQTLSLRERQYIEAARAIAQRDYLILSRHLFPNLVSLVIVQASITAAYAIIVETALSFLGVGVMPPTPSWGSMLSRAQPFLDSAPWMAIGPGLAIFLLVMGLNLLGDGLRDAFDPRTQG